MTPATPLMPLKRYVFLIGVYCPVMIFTASCPATPPNTLPMLCISAPLNLHSSSAMPLTTGYDEPSESQRKTCL